MDKLIEYIILNSRRRDPVYMKLEEVRQYAIRNHLGETDIESSLIKILADEMIIKLLDRKMRKNLYKILERMEVTDIIIGLNSTIQEGQSEYWKYN